MNDCKVIGFREIFINMNDIKHDYTLLKVKNELDYMMKGYVIKKWYKTTRNGTKADFEEGNTKEIEKRLEELKEISENYIKRLGSLLEWG